MRSQENARHLAAAEVPWHTWTGSELPEHETRRERLYTRIVAIVMLVVTFVYLAWRVLFTIDPGSYLLGIPLWIAESWAFITALLYVFTLWDMDSVEAPEPRHDGPDVVTVLIPTYNEPVEVLLPPIAAAQRMERVAAVWVLDDGQREWVRDLCGQMGVQYRTRLEHEHAKAGNVNAALPDVVTPFVLILDSDHVPASDLVPKLIPYFDDPKVAVVQTPQDFYNQKSFEHEQLHDGLFSEEELFYRGMLTGRNRWGAAFWCGTGAILRMEALRDIGLVATDSVTEDILTSIRLHRHGWKTVHHNEVLARGLAAADAEQYLLQRLRWAHGAMQTLRAERFMTRKGLTIGQRLSYLATLTGWFDAWRAWLLIALPALSLILARTVLTGTWQIFVILFVTSFVLQRYGLARLARGRVHIWTSTVFDAIRMPTQMRATTALVWMRDLPFHVTPKGRNQSETSSRERPEAPALLLATVVLLVIAEIVFIFDVTGVIDMHYPQQSMAWVQAFWCAANLWIVTAAMLRIRADRFASDRRASVRVPVHGEATLDGTPVSAADLSFGGVLVQSPVEYERFTDVHFSARGITMLGTVTNRTVRDDGYLISIRWYPGQEIDAARLTSPVLV